MKKFAIALALVVGATSAQAWGDREQGALLGLVIGGVLSGQMVEARPQIVYPPQQIMIHPQQQLICGYNIYCGPTACYQEPSYQEPIWDHYGRVIGYRTICRRNDR